MSRSQRHREAAPSFVAGTREALRCTRLPKASLQFPKAHASLLSVCSSCSTTHAGRSQTTPLETRPHSTSAFTPPASATQWRPRVRRVSLDAQVGGLSPPPDHLKRPPSIAPSVPGRTRGGRRGVDSRVFYSLFFGTEEYRAARQTMHDTRGERDRDTEPRWPGSSGGTRLGTLNHLSSPPPPTQLRTLTTQHCNTVGGEKDEMALKGGRGEGGDRGRYITRTSCVTAAVTGRSGGCESVEIPRGRARREGHLRSILLGQVTRRGRARRRGNKRERERRRRDILLP